MAIVNIIALDILHIIISMHIFLENVRYSVMRASVCSLPDWSKIIIMGDLYFLLAAALLFALCFREHQKYLKICVLFKCFPLYYVLCLIDILWMKTIFNILVHTSSPDRKLSTLLYSPLCLSWSETFQNSSKFKCHLNLPAISYIHIKRTLNAFVICLFVFGFDWGWQ